jgi:lipopolysaccharide biosynthesis glycosyltransferase
MARDGCREQPWMMSHGTPVLAACFNAPYVPHVATMLRSFAESANGPTRWYLVNDDSVSPAVLKRLLDFARDCGLTAESFSIPDDLVDGFQEGVTRKYPRIAWYRAVLADALAKEDRLLYLDSDLLVLHDLRALWDTALGEGDLFGAVAHPSYGRASRECQRLGLPLDAPLLNSGVMVMDLAAMRSEEFAQRIQKFVLSPERPELRYADQDAMNVLFAGRWTSLDPTWNCMNVILLPFVAGASWADDIHHDAVLLERAARSPAVVHFEGATVFRPWHRRCFNPFTGLYRHYRSTTPWPLLELEGGRRDEFLSRLPPRAQAKVWQFRNRGV